MTLEFVTDPQRYHAGLDWNAVYAEAQQVYHKFNLGEPVHRIQHPISGCMGVQHNDKAYLETDLAPRLVEAGYLLHSLVLAEYSTEHCLCFGIPAPANLWERGSNFRLEVLNTAQTGLHYDAERYAFERQVSGLIDEGWEIQQVLDSPGIQENYARLTVALVQPSAAIAAQERIWEGIAGEIEDDRIVHRDPLKVGDTVIIEEAARNVGSPDEEYFAEANWIGIIREQFGEKHSFRVSTDKMKKIGETGCWFDAEDLYWIPF